MEAYAKYQAEAKSWAEGGDNRTALHIAGGALIGGLGGGGIGTAAAGAAGVGVASAFAGKLNGLADDIGGATGSMTVGNIAANVLAGLAGLGGALVGDGAGAATASNADLYNRSEHNQNGQGGTGSQVLDTAVNTAAGVWNGLVSLGEVIANVPNGGPLASPGDPGYISASGLKLPYTPGDQIGEGVEFAVGVLATRGIGKGAAAEATADAKAFEKSLVSLPPGERVAQVKQTAQTVAADNGWQKGQSA